MIRYITHVRKDEEDRIIAVKTYDLTLKTSEVVERIKKGIDKFYVKEGTKEISVGIYKEKWIRTYADGYWNNNLDNLPRF